MLDAMHSATYGDDSRDGDPTVLKLEALAARRPARKLGAYMPSGTMTNLVAMLTHAQRGGEVLLEEGSHTLSSELGGIAALAGLFYRTIPGVRGAMDLDVLSEKIKPTQRNQMGTALVWMENSHNRAGGAVLPLAHIAEGAQAGARKRRARARRRRAPLQRCSRAGDYRQGGLATLRQRMLSACRKACRHRSDRCSVAARRIHPERARGFRPHGRRQHAPGRPHRRRRRRRAEENL